MVGKGRHRTALTLLLIDMMEGDSAFSVRTI